MHVKHLPVGIVYFFLSVKKAKNFNGQMLQMNREEKSLCHDAMVLNFLDDNQAQI